VTAQAADSLPTKSFTYKKTTQADLELIVHYPSGWNDSDKRPAIVFFFGGGWTGGKVEQFEPQAIHLARRGMVAARADYRVKSRHGVTPKECVEDAKSAIRWVRAQAAQLGVDPNRIVAAGGSAGGHIAACTALAPGLDAEAEDASVSSTPDVLVLFNPVLRFEGIPQLMERIGNDAALGKAISPTLHLVKESPPTLIFFGTADRLAAMGDEFLKRSKELGHRAELFTAEGQPHGFFNRPPWQERTTQRMDEFLTTLGYLQPKKEGAGSATRRESSHLFTIETSKPEDRIELKLDGNTATLSVHSPSGIGRAKIATKDGNWPATVVLQLHLAGLEHVEISNGKLRLAGAVTSHGGNPARQQFTVTRNGGEEALEPSVRIFDADGRPTTRSSGKGGFYEITVPTVILASVPQHLEVAWVDFYRS
jgi:acetyl esterase/lipase